MPYTIALRNGKLEDIKFIRKEFDTEIKAGDVLLGQLFKDRNTWAVVVNGYVKPGLIRTVSGFRTRYDALQYCLMVHEETREN